MVELLWGAFVRVGQVGHAERNHDAHITRFSHLKCLSLVLTEQVMVSLLIESRACHGLGRWRGVMIRASTGRGYQCMGGVANTLH